MVKLRHVRLAALVVVASMLAAQPATAQGRDEPEQVVMVTIGDSYAAGFGGGYYFEDSGCDRSLLAPGRLLARRMELDGWDVDHRFVACTGHRRSQLDGQWEEAQLGAVGADIIVLSIGGNDLGFSDILTRCVTWGCDFDEVFLRYFINVLAILLEWEYTEIVETRLAAGGQLYVTGYPRLFDDFDQDSCSRVFRESAEALNRLSEHLNEKMREAVDNANATLNATQDRHDHARTYGTRVHYVETLSTFRDLELCGSRGEAIHGVELLDVFGGSDAFHPNVAGYVLIAGQLVQKVTSGQSAFPHDPRSAPHTVMLSVGNRALNKKDCTSAACRWLDVNLTALPSGSHEVACWSSRDTSAPWWRANFSGRSVSPCYFGYPGEQVWVTVDGIPSNRVTWPRP